MANVENPSETKPASSPKVSRSTSIAAKRKRPGGAEKRKIAATIEIASLDDEIWRAEIARGLQAAKTLQDPTAHVALTPAGLVPDALEFLSHQLPEDYWRVAQQFDFAKKRGAITVSDEQNLRLQALGAQFAKGPDGPPVFRRNLLIVALFIYARELQARARLRSYKFVAQSLASELSTPEVFSQVQAKTKIDHGRLKALAKGSASLARELEAGGAMIEVVQIYEAMGKRPMDVLIAAANASDENDFQHRLGNAAARGT